jgi:UDP:flavonoid glycosyltransferase YjiC (YdhE family)
MSRALFCWEVGEGSGHVVPYLSLIEALRNRGWEVAVAARNTAEVGARIRASGATLLQAPICLGIFPEMDANSWSTTELLLQYGYGYEQTFDGVFSSWLALMQLWKPDLVIGSHAPTAHLASQCLSIADIAIGSGFNCPVAANPAPLMRPWQQGIEKRIAASEDRVRQTVNAVLQRHGFTKRQFPMDMYEAVPVILCTLPELDHFRAHRGAEAAYFGALPAVAIERHDHSVTVAVPHEIFVYLRYTPFVDSLIAALAKRTSTSLIYLPNISPAQRAGLELKYGSSLVFAEQAVDVGCALAQAKLVISNAGHSLTMQSFLAGKPMLLMPTHWEQTAVADMALKLGAATAVLPSEQHPKFHRRIDEMLQQPAYRLAAEEFANRSLHLTGEGAIQRALFACERRAQSHVNRTKLTAVG